MYIEYPEIPQVPEYLIETDFEVVKTFQPYSPVELEELDLYFLRKNPDIRLVEFLQPYFDFDVTDRIFYQYIGKNLGVHKDFSRKSCFNYIINKGGDNVITSWYDEDLNKLYDEIIPEKVWHKIYVDINHGVENVIGKRFSLTVFQDV